MVQRVRELSGVPAYKGTNLTNEGSIIITLSPPITLEIMVSTCELQGEGHKHADHNILPDHIPLSPGITATLNFVFLTSLFLS